MPLTVEFNVPEGETIAREQLIAYLNVADSYESPEWAPIGSRVIESTASYDWQTESNKDILGMTRSTMKKPIMTQPFDAWTLSNGDKAQLKLYQLGIVEQNAQALANLDMLIAHWFTTNKGTVAGSFAERYASCMIPITSIGGGGGGNVEMPIEVTYGGERTLGGVSKGSGGAITFTPYTED